MITKYLWIYLPRLCLMEMAGFSYSSMRITGMITTYLWIYLPHLCLMPIYAACEGKGLFTSAVLDTKIRHLGPEKNSLEMAFTTISYIVK